MINYCVSLERGIHPSPPSVHLLFNDGADAFERRKGIKPWDVSRFSKRII